MQSPGSIIEPRFCILLPEATRNVFREYRGITRLVSISGNPCVASLVPMLRIHADEKSSEFWEIYSAHYALKQYHINIQSGNGYFQKYKRFLVLNE